MNDVPHPPQFPNPNQPPTLPAGFETPAAEQSGVHPLAGHGTEMMQPPQRPEVSSTEEASRAAIARLSMGESVVVHLPEGNTRVVYRGIRADGSPIYEETLLSPRPAPAPRQQPGQPSKPVSGGRPGGSAPAPQVAPRPANPYALDPRAQLPPPAFGPQGGISFGPRGTHYEEPERPIAPATRMGNQPPEAHPDSGPEFVEADLPDEDKVYVDPLESGRQKKFRPPVAAEQTGPEKGLADQLSEGTAPPIAEMSEEDRPDMTAIRRPGASAAAARAEQAAAAEDETPDIQGVGVGGLPEDQEPEADLTQLLSPDVVPLEGQRPPGTDFMPGGGPRLYRR